MQIPLCHKIILSLRASKEFRKTRVREVAIFLVKTLVDTVILSDNPSRVKHKWNDLQMLIRHMDLVDPVTLFWLTSWSKKLKRTHLMSDYPPCLDLQVNVVANNNCQDGSKQN